MTARPSAASSPVMRRALVMMLALLLDVMLGDLPNRFHPVAWCGQAIAAARRLAPTQGRIRPFFFGLSVTLAGCVTCAGAGMAARRVLIRLPRGVSVLGEALLLKQTVALRGLGRAAHAVAQPLAADDLGAARRALAWHLVSRDTANLDASAVAAAAVESVAENASDGVIAPLLYYLVGGLPAAWTYRWVNTLDAMWGYRDAAREWLGKGPARVDDGLNWVPARVTAVLLILVAPWGAHRRAWATWRRDRGLTASPNAGQSMSAAAGALGVELAKPDAYRLGAGLPLPDATTIARSVRLLYRAVLLLLVVTMGWAWLMQPRATARSIKTRYPKG